MWFFSVLTSVVSVQNKNNVQESKLPIVYSIDNLLWVKNKVIVFNQMIKNKTETPYVFKSLF